MNNKSFYETMSRMIEDRSLIYAEKALPDTFVRIKIGGHFMASDVQDADILRTIQEKMKSGQFFTETQLNRATGKSSTFSRGEVERGKYARIYAGKFKLYIVKDW